MGVRAFAVEDVRGLLHDLAGQRGDVRGYCRVLGDRVEQMGSALPELVEEFSVIHARGYPAPHHPWPQTRENAERFVRENGGTLRHRFVTEWAELDPALVEGA